MRGAPGPELEVPLGEGELAALRAAAAGKTTRQDAAERAYSAAWVREQRGSAMRKLGAGNITAAVATAMRLGLLSHF